MVDLHSIHKDVENYLGYLGTPDVINRFSWKKVKSGEGLFAVDSKEPVLLTLVGRVSDDRFAVGPSGNYRTYGSAFPPFQYSKYTFSLKEPAQDDDPFTEDWVVAWDNLLKLQASISKLPLRRNLLESGEVRMSTPVVEKLVSFLVSATIVMILIHFSHRIFHIMQFVRYSTIQIRTANPMTVSFPRISQRLFDSWLT